MKCEDEMLWDTSVNEGFEGLYADAFEAAVWGLVRLWLDAAYGAIQLHGCCYPLVYVWDKVCAALGRGYLGRDLTQEERLIVWGVLEAVQYPG